MAKAKGAKKGKKDDCVEPEHDKAWERVRYGVQWSKCGGSCCSGMHRQTGNFHSKLARRTVVHASNDVRSGAGSRGETMDA